MTILIVFDIDETLLQFIPRHSYNVWEKVNEKVKSKFNYKFYPEKKDCIVFRPNLGKWFDFVNSHSKNVKIALWTYSERDYANDMADLMIEHFGLKDDPFLFKYGLEDIEDEDTPKDLRKIWRQFPKFNKFNTFLVDDRAANLVHPVNNENSILIEPFAPFGLEKKRTVLTRQLYRKSINDKMFLVLIDITKKILKDLEGVDEDEFEEALGVETVFAPSKIERKKLSKHLSKYTRKNKPVSIMTIGNPHTTGYMTKDKKGSKTKKIRL